MRVWFDALGPAEHFFISGSSLGFVNWKWEHFGQLQHFDIFLSQGSHLTSNDALCVPCSVALWGYHWANEWVWAFFFFLLLFWSQGSRAVHLKLPSSFGQVLLQPLIYLQHDWHTTSCSRRGQCNTWGSICGGGSSLNLLPSASLAFSDQHGSCWRQTLLYSEPLGALGCNLSGAKTKEMQEMPLPNATQGLIWGEWRKKGRWEL